MKNKNTSKSICFNTTKIEHSGFSLINFGNKVTLSVTIPIKENHSYCKPNDSFPVSINIVDKIFSFIGTIEKTEITNNYEIVHFIGPQLKKQEESAC